LKPPTPSAGEELEIVKRNDEIKKRNKKAERLDMSIIETSNRVEQLKQG
jgi:hypothetical protein